MPEKEKPQIFSEEWLEEVYAPSEEEPWWNK